MNRGYLALGAAFALAAIMGLYVMLREDEDAAAKRASPEQKNSAAAAIERAHTRSTVPAIAPSEHARPGGPSGTDVGASESPSGNVRIRDHRSGEQAPVDVPPAIHPPEGRKIPSHLTSDLAQRLRTITTECAASVLPDARGAKPRLEGEVLIAIKDHQATITGATYQVRDVADEAQGSIKQCMEQKSVGVATPSGDEPDVEGYPITLSFRLP